MNMLLHWGDMCMKSLLSIDELIEHMKERGIKFEIISESDARTFLTNNNYYFKLASYRTLYAKCPDGSSREGQYQNLDFAYLKELSTIDMYLRYIIIEMCLDIEHAIKVRLINAVTQNSNDDGYQLIKLYLKDEDPGFNILKSIRSHKSGEYCKDLIQKYYPYFPVWVLVELISFGDLLHLCRFYEKTYNCSLIPNNKFMNTIRDLRNASAHSNCLMNKMTVQMEATKQPDSTITCFVKGMSGISASSRAKNLNKTFVYNMVTLLYVYNELMPSIAKQKKYLQLQEFLNGRAIKNKNYFKSNSQITGVYNFLKKVIDNLSNTV